MSAKSSPRPGYLPPIEPPPRAAVTLSEYDLARPPVTPGVELPEYLSINDKARATRAWVDTVKDE